ncbi:NAD(P)H-dependent oxidoreductase [Pseudomonas sp. MWU13-2517]|uniref:FMN-dependent NADH-azoreductase n=1 Tax=Pseudomonas sp. MWU13-2517 TaxID=2929055 RepID=UPI00200D2FDF|nr:NAD(P)H-dependent oxidoreductase [Pseudomonas sp. MWU13-2517]
MNVLHIDSSIMGSDSITRDLSAAIVARIQAIHPDTQVQYRDLANDEVRHLSGSIAAGFRQTGISDFPAATLLEHQLSETLVTEFLASDVLIIGAPMYNFSVSSQLKAWLDRIAQVGRTFKYTEHGPVGLAGGKRVIVVSARGGFYADGPFQKMDFQESYLKAFFGFLGITDIEFVRAEGASKGEQSRDKGVALARSAIPDAVARLSAAAL